MNQKLLKLALDGGLINYIDHETPRVYFICGLADIEDVEKFAELIVRECAEICLEANDHKNILRHFDLDNPS